MISRKDYTEFEAKFYPVDKDKYRAKLQSIGAMLVVPERKMLRLVADYRDNPTLGNRECVRVRDEGNLIRLSFKSFADNAKEVSDQKEIETEVDNFSATVKIFEKLGLKFNRRQETLREEWDYKGVQVTIDTWPGLTEFTEIEGNSEKEVKDVSKVLGFDWNEKLIMPASGLYARVYGISDKEALKKISNISFENIPFTDLKKVWTPKFQAE
jgi:predicted adenylyl cyclase CyaB